MGEDRAPAQVIQFSIHSNEPLSIDPYNLASWVAHGLKAKFFRISYSLNVYNLTSNEDILM